MNKNIQHSISFSPHLLIFSVHPSSASQRKASALFLPRNAFTLDLVSYLYLTDRQRFPLLRKQIPGKKQRTCQQLIGVSEQLIPLHRVFLSVLIL